MMNNNTHTHFFAKTATQLKNDHHRQVQRHCRVCGSILRTKKACSIHHLLLFEAYGIDTSKYSTSVHLKNFCTACYQRGRRMIDTKSKGTPYSATNFSPIAWLSYSDDSSSCPVCDRFKVQSKGGRPKRATQTQGRPGSLSPQAVRTVVKALGVRSLHLGGPLHPSRFEIRAMISLSDIQCTVCNNILDGLVQLSGGKMACSLCIISCAETGLMPCPCCKGEHNNSITTFWAPPDVVIKVLGGLPVLCEKPGCCALVALKDLLAHVEVSCPLLEQGSDTTCTVGHILSKPFNIPATDL